MEIKIPRKDYKLPTKCIVCSENSMDLKEGGALIRYNPENKTTPELKRFSMVFPLCKMHFNNFKQGRKLGKIAMFLMGCSFIPFIIGLIIFEISKEIAFSTPFLVTSFLCSISGYMLLSPSNKLLKENGRGQIWIKVITDLEIIVEIQNQKVAECYSKKPRSHKKHRK